MNTASSKDLFASRAARVGKLKLGAKKKNLFF